MNLDREGEGEQTEEYDPERSSFMKSAYLAYVTGQAARGESLLRPTQIWDLVRAAWKAKPKDV